MKQLGNLAIVCAQRPEVLLLVHKGTVELHVGEGPSRESIVAEWQDDEKVSSMIHELNHGQYKRKEGLLRAA